MSRYVSYGDHFYEERVADKYGVILQQDELAYPIILTGAIIDCVQYGNIVSIENYDNIVQPHTTDLFQNYPNPFNPVTKIQFNLPEDTQVSLVVYNVRGQKVKEHVNGFKSAGSYTVTFDGTGLASGVYFYRIHTNSGFSQSRKLMLLR